MTPSSLKRAAMVPNTGIFGAWLNSSRLRWYLLAHVAQGVLAPAVELVDGDTKSAKSSMSIFSSWLAAPNSGVMTYSDNRRSGNDRGVALADAPEVSTMIRSNPRLAGGDHLGQRRWRISLPVSRVASERMKMLACSIAFMRMRSPSSAPPVRLREGRWRRRRSASSWSRRKRRPARRCGDLPAPPVPVMPSVGILDLRGRVAAP